MGNGRGAGLSSSLHPLQAWPLPSSSPHWGAVGCALFQVVAGPTAPSALDTRLRTRSQRVPPTASRWPQTRPLSSYLGPEPISQDHDVRQGGQAESLGQAHHIPMACDHVTYPDDVLVRCGWHTPRHDLDPSRLLLGCCCRLSTALVLK
jgi:hypothetical protein